MDELPSERARRERGNERGRTPSASMISISCPSIQMWNMERADILTTRILYFLPGTNFMTALSPTWTPLESSSWVAR